MKTTIVSMALALAVAANASPINITTDTLVSSAGNTADQQQAAIVPTITFESQTRLGDNSLGSGTWEFSIGNGSGTIDKGQATWVSGQTYDFRLTSDPLGSTTFLQDAATGGGTLTSTLPSLASGTYANNLFIRAFSQTGSTTESSTVDITSLTIDGSSNLLSSDLSIGANSTDYDGTRILQIIASGASFADGFSISGNWTPVFASGSGAASKTAFDILAGGGSPQTSAQSEAPEPGTFGLLGLGLVVFGCVRFRHRSGQGADRTRKP